MYLIGLLASLHISNLVLTWLTIIVNLRKDLGTNQLRNYDLIHQTLGSSSITLTIKTSHKMLHA